MAGSYCIQEEVDKNFTAVVNYPLSYMTVLSRMHELAVLAPGALGVLYCSLQNILFTYGTICRRYIRDP